MFRNVLNPGNCNIPGGTWENAPRAVQGDCDFAEEDATAAAAGRAAGPAGRLWAGRPTDFVTCLGRTAAAAADQNKVEDGGGGGRNNGHDDLMLPRPESSACLVYSV